MRGPTKLTEKEKEVIKKLAENQCEYCTEKERLDVHRIIRGNEGATYIARNCQVLCNNHHKLFHAHEEGIGK